jgi:DNA-binding HxlR family transcriptional regulator
MPSPTSPLPDCSGVGDLLSRIGDKWSVQVVVVLHHRAERFNGVKRGVPGISQQVLTRTLRNLERDGLIDRTVRATTPPQADETWNVSGGTGAGDGHLGHRQPSRDSGQPNAFRCCEGWRGGRSGSGQLGGANVLRAMVDQAIDDKCHALFA